VKMVVKVWVPQCAGKFLSSCTNGDLVRMAQLHGVNDSMLFNLHSNRMFSWHGT
jgi:hypothetical protein